MNILFDSEDVPEFSSQRRSLIERAIEQVLESEGLNRDFEISVSMVGNEKIRELNRRFRGIDRATDVLSFPMYNSLAEIQAALGLGVGMVMLGDIVISPEKAEEQAREFGHGIERELSFLAVHGALHLLGYDHMTPQDERIMFGKQDEILTKL